MTKKREHNVDGARKGPNLKSLEYSYDKNPLLVTGSISVKQRHVRTGLRQDLVNATTGEVHGVATVHEVIEKDDEDFVKVFADGVKAAFGLSRTAARVFQLVLSQYQNEPMAGGYADSVYLAWFDGGLSGQDVGMADRTFQTGLRELLSKNFLAPKSPNIFWVNPSLFFKGNRVLFIREYVRKQHVKDSSTHREIEVKGQQHLID